MGFSGGLDLGTESLPDAIVSSMEGIVFSGKFGDHGLLLCLGELLKVSDASGISNAGFHNSIVVSTGEHPGLDAVSCNISFADGHINIQAFYEFSSSRNKWSEVLSESEVS